MGLNFIRIAPQSSSGLCRSVVVVLHTVVEVDFELLGGEREQHVVRHQQLSVVLDLLKQKGHRRVPMVTGGNHQQAVGTRLWIVAGLLAVEQGGDCFARGCGGDDRVINIAELGMC